MDTVGSSLFCSKNELSRENVKLSHCSVVFAVPIWKMHGAAFSTVILGYLNKTMLTGGHACLPDRRCFVLFDVFFVLFDDALFCLIFFCSV